MRITWTVGLLLLFLVGTLISITLEGEYIGTDTTNVFYKLMRPDFGQFTNPLSAIGGFFLLVWDWLQASGPCSGGITLSLSEHGQS